VIKLALQTLCRGVEDEFSAGKRPRNLDKVVVVCVKKGREEVTEGADEFWWVPGRLPS
jgi:hypothetical protein